MRIPRPLSALACTGAATALFVAASAPAQAAPLPIGGLPEAGAGYALHPGTVAGANDWSCKPSAAHPNPVVLLPGTFANIGSNFVALSPMLKNAGYCVFATNFGMTWFSGGRIGGMRSETDSGNEVAAFIDRVRATTGAAKVDIVGHSQGGSMGVNYLKLHGGGNAVGTYVGWGQSSNGTTLSGLTTLGKAFGTLGFVNLGIQAFGAPSLVDQQVGSAYNTRTGAIPLPQGPKYVTIQSTKDAVVTPYATQSLPGAQNIVVQQLCPSDPVGHVGLFLDQPTLQLTMNALGGGPAGFKPACSGYGPAL
ncbi:alpha/beta fold hydrolase [Flexivirga sp. ID2601S]|uniref:Alpha/beta fold hydrolase n=1 Tax=Flexivirga aerilata TaxID=1656889 RepID=A0A849AL87_9MICO|nr:alpha/beta fold hydrolase [Flexivirga aerilata]NNG39150.1 alpha/beta fold hydrolase [Flexivirga aerilata]